MSLTMADPTAAWTIGDMRRAFREHTSPDPADMVGRWDGGGIGRAPIQRGMRVIMSLLPFRGWVGKEFDDLEHMRNLVRRDGEVRATLPGRVGAGESLLDAGTRALIVTYPDVPPPVRWMRAELRWLAPRQSVLGMILIPVGAGWLGPFPYRLDRPAQSRPTAGP